MKYLWVSILLSAFAFADECPLMEGEYRYNEFCSGHYSGLQTYIPFLDNLAAKININQTLKIKQEGCKELEFTYPSGEEKTYSIHHFRPGSVSLVSSAQVGDITYGNNFLEVATFSIASDGKLEFFDMLEKRTQYMGMARTMTSHNLCYLNPVERETLKLPMSGTKK